MNNIKIHGIIYGDQAFQSSRDRAYESLSKFTDKAYLFTEKDLDNYRSNIDSRILYPGARGGGYWIFKPIFLKQVIDSIPEGEAVMWVDAGIECIGDTHIFADIAANNRGFCLFKQKHENSHYTKRDCFYYMNADTTEYHTARQSDAAVQVYIKNEETQKFINEYLHYCSDYRVVTDSPNECNLPNFPCFADHRHDQSILTNLYTKYKLNTFIQPSQWYHIDWTEDIKSRYLNDIELNQSERYSALFNHHLIRS
jgi:hypothetical protein